MNRSVFPHSRSTKGSDIGTLPLCQRDQRDTAPKPLRTSTLGAASGSLTDTCEVPLTPFHGETGGV
jgi:hypothetical protein